METNNPNSEFAERFLGRLVTLGVEHIVVCPGSRSQALALAAAKLEKLGRIRLHVRVDERSAAFTALGLAIESGMPAAVIVTSGTAVANLLPAVVEAHHSGVPMLLLTADRPAELRGIGTSQTTQQRGMFNNFLRAEYDREISDMLPIASEYAEDLATEALTKSLNPPGPVQLNLAFSEPLSGYSDHFLNSGLGLSDPESVPLRSTYSGLGSSSPESVPLRFTNSGEYGSEVTGGERIGDYRDFLPLFPELVITPEVGTVVIAGHGAGEQAARAATELGAPLIAEVSSGARFGPNLVVSYRKLLQIPELRGSIQRVLIFGLPTLSREVPMLLGHDIEQIVVHGRHAEIYDPHRRGPKVYSSVNVMAADESHSAALEEYLRRWIREDRRMLREADNSLPAPDLALAQDSHYLSQSKFAAKELEVTRTKVDRQSLVEAVWNATWPHDRLVVGASMLIRSLDAIARGRKIRVHANRGVAGIDGVVSTAVGVTAARKPEEPGITRLLIGDLSLVHDSGGLFLNPAEPKPRILIIVGNDGGGSLFDQLEVFQSAERADYDRVVYVPHTVNIQQLAESFGWEYLRAETRGELDRMLAGQVLHPTILEVPLER